MTINIIILFSATILILTGVLLDQKIYKKLCKQNPKIKNQILNPFIIVGSWQMIQWVLENREKVKSDILRATRFTVILKIAFGLCVVLLMLNN